MSARTWAAAGALALATVTSAVFVDSGDVAVVYRFGAIDRTLDPGLGFRAPWPIERHVIVDVSEVRRSESGPVRMLTGDTNLVDIDLAIQYRIDDPIAYQVGLADAEQTLLSVVLSTTSDIIATVGVDALLTTGRTQLQADAETASQAMLDRYQTGIAIDAVEVRELVPPPPVVDAFNDVSSARGDRETLALSAEAYRSKRLPEVRGEANEMLEQARTHAAMIAARSSGEIAQFTQLLDAKREAPVATRVQLWSEAAEAIGQSADVHVLRDETEIAIDD
ncbi:MAG: FtsH protease activity modulator HflK [Myxococcota bacterium]|nr:FtsH protease activity modulator HflK [Myxococcota bacterium]MEC9388641.1 FtsH protease activity modulator HflK [Myxococcota bacterium]